MLTVAGAVLLAVALLAYAARYLAARRTVTIAVVALSPYLMLAAPLGAVVFAVGREWAAVGIAAVLVLVVASSQARLFRAAEVPADAARVVVMSANLRLGLADPDAVVAAVRRAGAEVLAIQELTADAHDRLVAAGLNALLPYRATDPRDGAAGTGLWSRYPLTDIRFPDGFTNALVTAVVDPPGASSPVSVGAVHVSGPIPEHVAWQRDLDALRTMLPKQFPAIVAGDFNATPDAVQFRRLLSDGYRDAAEQAGAGITGTYPADQWHPPLIAIDHVLTRGTVATAVRTVRLPGSDHRALVVTVAVPS